jgi:hypothetical protein
MRYCALLVGTIDQSETGVAKFLQEFCMQGLKVVGAQPEYIQVVLAQSLVR